MVAVSVEARRACDADALASVHDFARPSAHFDDQVDLDREIEWELVDVCLNEGIGIIEAPRGTLIHDYDVGEDDLVKRCNLIVSTTHNNQAMNEAVRAVARDHLDGRVLTEGLLNHIEVAIRAYDPCLSCATHALGKMPLEVSLLGHDGALLDRVRKADGELLRDMPGGGAPAA